MSGVLVGYNNTVKNNGVVITGDNNAVTGKNVQVLGGNSNIINANNVTLINTSGQTVTENGATYIDGSLYIKASDMSGQATLVSGSVIVPFMGVSATSVILVTDAGSGTLSGTLSVSAGINLFTISSSSGTDTATVNWYIAKL